MFGFITPGICIKLQQIQCRYAVYSEGKNRLGFSMSEMECCRKSCLKILPMKWGSTLTTGHSQNKHKKFLSDGKFMSSAQLRRKKGNLKCTKISFVIILKIQMICRAQRSIGFPLPCPECNLNTRRIWKKIDNPAFSKISLLLQKHVVFLSHDPVDLFSYLLSDMKFVCASLLKPLIQTGNLHDKGLK